MQLACPSCETAFHVSPEALGSGRNVRCAVCRNVWFASPADAVPELEYASADAVTSAAPEITPEPPMMQSLIHEPDTIEWNEPAIAEVNPSPPLAPFAIADTPVAKSAPAPKKAGRAKPVKKAPGRSRLATMTAILAAIIVVAIGSRTSIVRAVPDLAGLYAAIGLPVNLRGLEFQGVNTAAEVQDGITVLVIEGEVANVTRQPVELPRLRLSILDANQRELYSWTSMLPRSILADGERIAFRSRLASPPAEGKEVLVRFLSRSDLTSAR